MTDTRRLREHRWRAPRGDTWREVIADATAQVIRAYGPALRALALHDADPRVARAALDRLDSHEKADPLHREAGRGIGRDGDTEVETIRWDDGSYTVADVRRSDSHEKADGPPR